MGNAVTYCKEISCDCSQANIPETNEVSIPATPSKDFLRIREEFLQRRISGKGPRIQIHSTGSQRRKVDKQAFAQSLSPDRDLSPSLIQYRGVREDLSPYKSAMEGSARPRSRTPQRTPTKQFILWNPQPKGPNLLANGMRSSGKCFWRLAQAVRIITSSTSEFAWNIQPWSDEKGPNSNLYSRLPSHEFQEQEIENYPTKTVDFDERSLSSERKKVKFDDASSKNSPSVKESVASEDLFQEGLDDIVMQGELMKFKPGLSANFISRYVQISQRAFRYFRNRFEATTGRPIVAFRKKIIRSAVPYAINKASYLKRGSRIAQSGKEDAFFDNMFEIELNEHYEDNFRYRDIERATKDAKERDEFRIQVHLKQLKQTASKLNEKISRQASAMTVGTRNQMQETRMTRSFSSVARLEHPGQPERGSMQIPQYNREEVKSQLSVAQIAPYRSSVVGPNSARSSHTGIKAKGASPNALKLYSKAYSEIDMTSPQRMEVDGSSMDSHQFHRADETISGSGLKIRRSTFIERFSSGKGFDSQSSLQPTQVQSRKLRKTRSQFIKFEEQPAPQTFRQSSIALRELSIQGGSKRGKKKTEPHSKKTKIIGGHAMAIRDFSKGRQGKQAKLYDRSITQKEFGQEDNNGKDSMKWHNRQKDWYNAERRFIFAAPSQQLKSKWINCVEKERQRILSCENSFRNQSLGQQRREEESLLAPSKFKKAAARQLNRMQKSSQKNSLTHFATQASLNQGTVEMRSVPLSAQSKVRKSQCASFTAGSQTSRPSVQRMSYQQLPPHLTDSNPYLRLPLRAHANGPIEGGPFSYRSHQQQDFTLKLQTTESADQRPPLSSRPGLAQLLVSANRQHPSQKQEQDYSDNDGKAPQLMQDQPKIAKVHNINLRQLKKMASQPDLKLTANKN